MKRRQVLAGAMAASGAAALSKPALSQNRRELHLVTTWPRAFPGLGTGAQRFADAVTAATGARITVKVHGAGERFPTFEAFDAVARGDADMYHAFEYFWQAKSKAFAFFASVPFGLTASEFAAWVHHGGGQALWDTLSGRFGIKPFACGNTGGQMGGWYRREVNSLGDYQGLRVRMPGLGGQVLRRIGAKAVSLPSSQIVPALKAGDLDGTEWVGPWNDLALGLNEVAPYYYFPGFHEPGTAIGLGINKAVWDGLAPADQGIIANAAAGENANSIAEFDARNARALVSMRNRLGISMRRTPDSVLQAIGKASGEVVAQLGDSGDPMAREVYDGFRRFRRDIIPWSRVSEQAFRNARLLDFDY